MPFCGKCSGGNHYHQSGIRKIIDPSDGLETPPPNPHSWAGEIFYSVLTGRGAVKIPKRALPLPLEGGWGYGKAIQLSQRPQSRWQYHPGYRL
jgi:hypothetical protein